MRLVFVGTSKGARGTETHLVCLVRALASLGHEVVTVAHPEGFIARALGAEGLPIVHGVFRNAADPRGALSVRRALRACRADWLVGSFGHEYWPLLALGRSTKTPVALFRHINSPLKPLSRGLLPRLASRFIAVSESMRADLVEQGVPESRIQLLYNPLDVTHFRPDGDLRARTRAALGIGDDERLVGFVGALDKNKGAFMLARALNAAMAEEPRLRALWVGPEAAHGHLLGLISPALRARHTLRGWSNDVRSAYAAMDLFAVPSQAKETFGRVSIEAQACGVPVLASRTGGLPETLAEGETGLLVPPSDEAAWHRALVEAAALSPGVLRQMGEAGTQFVRARFAAATVAAAFIRLLQGTTAVGVASPTAASPTGVA